MSEKTNILTQLRNSKYLKLFIDVRQFFGILDLMINISFRSIFRFVYFSRVSHDH